MLARCLATRPSMVPVAVGLTAAAATTTTTKATMRIPLLSKIQRHSLQVRGYASPLVDEDSSLSHELDIPKQVHQLVNPSNYSKINLARDISQSARLEKRDIGEKMEGAIRTEKDAVHRRLDDLLDRELMPKDNPAEADLVAFLEGYHSIGSTLGCIKVLRKMRECDITPTPPQYAMVLNLACGKYQVRTIYTVAEEMRLAGLEDTNENYESFFNSLLTCLGNCNQSEMAYAVYTEMRERGLTPRHQGSHSIIVSLAKIGEIDLALQILQESVGSSITFDWKTYMGILVNASFYMHHKAYKLAFDQLTTVFGVQLTKGDYDYGLSIASKAGDYKLATSILESLGRLGYPIREREYEALFDSLIVSKKWETAFKVVGNMRQTGYGKTSRTLRTLVRELTAKPAQTERLVAEAYEAMLETSSTVPAILDTSTLNALVLSLALSVRVEAAFTRMNEWFDKHSVKRNIETYEGLLTGCGKSKGNKTVAEKTLGMMLDVDKLEPTKEIYELMIRVSLKQFNYEDAFVYLESMKAQKMAPGWPTYASIVRRCANVRDPRAKVALDEMRELGYTVTSALENYVAFNYKSGKGAYGDNDDGSDMPEHSWSGKADKDKTATLKDILGADAFKL
ncbi:hypothetical protein EV179_004020 [Coemansia sp. RSA 487]|nr:hypothetical protein EV179_004020 [Coemansia sp. RSA 487]